VKRDVHIVFVDSRVEGDLIKSEPVKRVLRQAPKNAGVLHHLLDIRVTAFQLLSSRQDDFEKVLVKVTDAEVKVKQSFVGIALKIDRK
jgi:hypothetical protein